MPHTSCPLLTTAGVPPLGRAALQSQRRHVSSFKVDPNFKRGNGYLHYAFKTKNQIDKEEREKMAAEWNSWDLETMARYKALKEWNRVAKPDDVVAKRELRMRLRHYATEGFRGNMPRPREMKMLAESQNIPGTMDYNDYIRDGDLTSLDLRLLMKYVVFTSIPPPADLLESLYATNHVLDDYSCGYFFNYCVLQLDRAVNTIRNDAHHAMYQQIKDCFTSMKLRENGHRCTLESFTYSQMIKCAALMHDLPLVLSLKAELIETKPKLLNASVYEGVFKCLVDLKRHDLCSLEADEMMERYGLGPTEECVKQLLRNCCLTGDAETGEKLWGIMAELSLTSTDVGVFTEKVRLASICGDLDKAWYHYREMLEHTNLKPDVEMCNVMLSVCSTRKQVDDIVDCLNTRVVECNEGSFAALFIASQRLGDVGLLEESWDMMQQQQVRPRPALLHTYLESLVAMPRNDDAYHPAEVLGRGLSGFEWATMSCPFNGVTMLLLLRLCAKAGQLFVAKGVMKKMLLNNIGVGAEHASAVLACIASSQAVLPLREVEGVAQLAEWADASTVLALHFVLQNRSPEIAEEDDAPQRLNAVWDTLLSKLDPSSPDFAEDCELLGEMRESASVEVARLYAAARETKAIEA
eukprot:TRINITY_DN18170_c0_g1_i1.p1 TRINITY_DN18170_c0_g1~~TRINITY_DN18170_c0_g1_i1.p1  ORF type:complete len:645 (+),score=267.45 TRINITY_DN18170_c0_g1_i1:26-1936(+)